MFSSRNRKQLIFAWLLCFLSRLDINGALRFESVEACLWWILMTDIYSYESLIANTNNLPREVLWSLVLSFMNIKKHNENIHTLNKKGLFSLFSSLFCWLIWLFCDILSRALIFIFWEKKLNYKESWNWMSYNLIYLLFDQI